MNYIQILNILSLAIPAFIAGTKKVVKGNEKYIVAIAVYFVLRKMTEVAGKNEVKNNIQENGALNYNAMAQMYRQAMNPSGYSWMIDFDLTNVSSLYELASKTINFDRVATAYSLAYGSDLTTDLRKELNTSEFNKFMNILNGIESYGS